MSANHSMSREVLERIKTHLRLSRLRLDAISRSAPYVPHSRHTVLVVDDDPQLLHVLAEILSRDGYDELTAQDAGQALALLDQYLPCMILLDVELPGTGGLALCRRIKQNLCTAHIPLALVTSRVGERDVIVHHGTLESGTNFISKPLRAVDLTRKIRRVLDSEIAEPSGAHEALGDDAKTEERAFGDALQALPPEILDRFWEAVIAARYGEMVAIIETIRALNPDLAAWLGQKAERFDYDGLRRLLSE